MTRKSPPPRARRPRGRPALAAEIGSRDGLLDAAVTLFAEQGVPATTSAEIAARAGVTPAMVHYHFRNRERLLDAVVDERLARFVGRVFGALPADQSSAAALIETIVRRVYDAAELMPWMPPIWIREVVSEGGTLRDRLFRHFPRDAVTALSETLAREQRQHRIPAGIEPRLAFLTIAGIAMLPLATRRLWSRIPGLAALSNAELLRHALTVLTCGLTPRRARTRRTR
jgi:TetR/AcrR family transcriptional regulator